MVYNTRRDSSGRKSTGGMTHMERRTFVKSAAGCNGCAGNGLRGRAAASWAPMIGFGWRWLGVNGRGKSHIAGFEPLENVEVATLVDPDRNSR